MINNLSNSLAGLSLVTGSNLGTGLFPNSAIVESKAVRLAKAQFTAPKVQPPWSSKSSVAPLFEQASAIRSLTSIIDRPKAGEPALPTDIQTAFITYKALDRLRILAETGAGANTTATERAAIEKTFARGLGDLKNFIANAPSDKLTLAFNQVSRRAETVPVDVAGSSEIAGAAVAKERADPLAKLGGNEVFTVSLAKNGGSDTVTIDLALTPQPPTLDTVAAALNAAIASVPMRNPDGSLALTPEGQEQPKWLSEFKPVKMENGWGLSLVTSGAERVAIDQQGARDALVVASGVTVLDAPTYTSVVRVDDAEGLLSRTVLGEVKATDRDATQLEALKSPKNLGSVAAPGMVIANTVAEALATDDAGFSYVVGTTSGDLGSNRSDGMDDLFLMKMDSLGKVVWQRTLGSAGKAEGAAITVGPNGDVMVAGTVSGDFDGTWSDGDMLVARFDTYGNEKLATVVRQVGSEAASAVALGPDGSIYIGGHSSSGPGGAFLARLDATGKVIERRTFGSDSSDAVRALSVDADGTLIALTAESGNSTLRRLGDTSIAVDLGSLDLGKADARSLAVAANGTIAVGGTTMDPAGGSQVNALSGGRDGFVALVEPSLLQAKVTYLGTTADDQVDSVAFVGANLYAGGRTKGDLSGPKNGSTDGFIARLDPASGAIVSTLQFGRATVQSEPVRVAAMRGGDNAITALGFARGSLNPELSDKLISQTALREGDEFSLRINGGSVRKVLIASDETMATLAAKVRRITGLQGIVATVRQGGGLVLRIDAKPGNSVDLLPGKEGKDALLKLGLNSGRLAARPLDQSNAPRVKPGGSFGLELSTALNVATKEDAAFSLGKIKNAISMSQTAFRSLYWDNSKEALVNGGTSKGHVSPYEAAQAGRYKDALTRLTASANSKEF
jgi:hypothetical protein